MQIGQSRQIMVVRALCQLAGNQRSEHLHEMLWAYPEDYTHIANCPVRRIDIIWQGDEIQVYEKLHKRTIKLQQEIPSYVKEIIQKHLA